jgi:peptidoglycan/xylan/chitin deacetylase (PgdA/CDA1 family)
MVHKLLSLCGRVLGQGKLSILIYHQVFTERDPMRPSEPDAATFDWHMRLLRQYFTPLSLTEASEHLHNNTLPANAICVTFDDGYLNNLTVAAPILKQYKIPATVYVATAFSHGDNMWNDRIIDLCADPQRHELLLAERSVILNDWDSRRIAAIKLINELKYLPVEQRLLAVDDLYRCNHASEYPARMMNPDQLATLSDYDIEVGAHTHNHPILKILPAEQQYAEIQQSKQLLELWLKKPVRHFAYPNGVIDKDLDQTAINFVDQIGFCTAVVTNWGTSSKKTPTTQLRRFTPWDPTPYKFHARLIQQLVVKDTA